MRSPNSILITGASSGLGAALARAFAAPGVTLFLGARNSGRLEETAAACREIGADADLARIDVTDAPAVTAWVESADDARPLDLVIANAGISGGSLGDGAPQEQARAIFATNVGGLVNTVEPAARRMRARTGGQIGLMSSLAGFRGLPGAPAYSASKAAVRSYGEALRGDLHRYKVGVTVICPGFVRTPMTDANDFTMPMLMEAAQAARIIKHGLARNHARIAFPWRLYALVRLLAALPPALTDPIFRHMPENR